jgi:Ca-activated chloride channel family protein
MMSDQNPERWIHAELRRVPLPEGLIERLRAIAGQGDEQLDAQLREVAVPPGLVGQLKLIVDDHSLDRQIAQVPLPAGLLEELRGVPDDEALDEAIRRVPAAVPAQVLAKLSGLPDRSRRWQRLRHRAAAASLLLTICICYFLTMLGLIADAYRPPEDEVLVVRFGREPINLVALAPVEIELIAPEPELPPPPGDGTGPVVELVAMRLDNRPTLPEEVFAPFAEYGPLDDVNLRSWQPLGSPHRADDELPELITVASPRARGIEPSSHPAYNRAFLFRHGEHPLVSPAAGSELASQVVPLSAATDSYDRAVQAVARGNVPDAQDTRVEDYLAGVNCKFPLPPPGELGIRTAAGPSVFGTRGAQLLQVGIQAGRTTRRDTTPTHLTVAVDVSASMRWGGRLDAARMALQRLVPHLEEGDRLSLVRFHEQAFLDKEFKGKADEHELLAAFEWLRPRGGTNVGAGLQMAASVALRHAAQEGFTPRVVLISDGVSGLPEREALQIERWLQEVSAEGIDLSVIDVSGGDGEEPLLARLAAAATGNIVRAESTEQIRWALVETLTGRPSLVAEDAVLTVSFDPRTVAAYRLLGHAPAAAGLMPQAAENSLRCLQGATALFEVWLHPNGGDEVATAKIEWRDPGSGETQRRQQRVSRLQFATSFAEASLSLQAATVAAETAEVLGQSSFVANKSRGLKDVLLLASEVNPRLAARPSYARFVAFLEQAERIRTRRGGDGR